MNKKFFYKNSYKWIISLFTPIMSGLFGWTIYYLWSSYISYGEGHFYTLLAITLLVLLPMTALFSICLTLCFRGYLLISNSNFTLKGIFKDKVVPLQKIHGFNITTTLNLQDQKGNILLKIPNSLQSFDEICLFCIENFSDLDEIEFENEQEKIIMDRENKISIDEKYDQIRTVKNILTSGSTSLFFYA